MNLDNFFNKIPRVEESPNQDSDDTPEGLDKTNVFNLLMFNKYSSNPVPQIKDILYS
jgi:hypothetical protein